jgi:hypothetical protein
MIKLGASRLFDIIKSKLKKMWVGMARKWPSEDPKCSLRYYCSPLDSKESGR